MSNTEVGSGRRSPSLQSFVWVACYCTLMLTPLVAAAACDPMPAARRSSLEFGVAAGFLAFALAMMQFALVSRIDASTRPFGADALMQFHRQMGVLTFGLVAAHALLLGPAAASVPFSRTAAAGSGAVAFSALVVLVGSSLFRRRLRLSYEAWQISHLAASVLMVVAMVGHLLAVRGYSRSPAVGGIVLTYAAGFMALTLRYRLVRPFLIWKRPWVVVANRDEGARTRTLRVAPVGHPGFAFAPGQFAWLITGGTPLWSQQHPISISSSAEPAADGAIEFSIKALGDWSGEVVPALAPGDRVWVDGPFGAFSPDQHAARGLVLIAGGIGIAPMRSILLTMKARGDRRPVVLFFAAADYPRLLFRPQLEALVSTLNMRLVYVLEEPDPDWKGERGRITRDLLVRHLPHEYREYQFFVCGPEPMMDALEKLLLARGVPTRSIQTERFAMV